MRHGCLGEGARLDMLRIIEVLIWIGAAATLMANAEPIVIAALSALYGAPQNAPPALLANLYLVSPIFPLILGVVAAVRLKLGGDRLRTLIGFQAATLPKDIALGLMVAAIGLAVTLASLKLLAPYLAVPPLQAMPIHAHLFFMTVGAVIPGFCEEFYYRGMLFNIAETPPSWLMVLLSAIGFALWHIGTPIYLAHTFVFGLMLGALTVTTRRLAPAIIAHTGANAGIGALLVLDLVDLSPWP
jgi:membrane protease YdiL (CAAX protease family)